MDSNGTFYDEPVSRCFLDGSQEGFPPSFFHVVKLSHFSMFGLFIPKKYWTNFGENRWDDPVPVGHRCGAAGLVKGTDGVCCF